MHFWENFELTRKILWSQQQELQWSWSGGVHMDPGQLRAAQAELCPAAGSVSALGIKAATWESNLNTYSTFSSTSRAAASIIIFCGLKQSLPFITLPSILDKQFLTVETQCWNSLTISYRNREQFSFSLFQTSVLKWVTVKEWKKFMNS